MDARPFGEVARAIVERLADNARCRLAGPCDA
jgi:hypothetical protein